MKYEIDLEGGTNLISNFFYRKICCIQSITQWWKIGEGIFADFEPLICSPWAGFVIMPAIDEGCGVAGEGNWLYFQLHLFDAIDNRIIHPVVVH